MFEYLVFREFFSFQGEKEIRIDVDGEKLRYRIVDETLLRVLSDSEKTKEGVYSGNNDSYIGTLESFNIPGWKGEYYIPACDGDSWELRYKEVGKPCRKITGSNDYPDCFEAFVDHLYSIGIK